MPPAPTPDQVQQYQLALLQQRILQVRCKEMETATVPVLKLGFDHPEPMYRYAACFAAGKNRMESMTDKLIEKLNDDCVAVQQMARSSLVRISKGEDFGPLPGCTCEQIQLCVMNWQLWFTNAKR